MHEGHFSIHAISELNYRSSNLHCRCYSRPNYEILWAIHIAMCTTALQRPRTAHRRCEEHTEISGSPVACARPRERSRCRRSVGNDVIKCMRPEQVSHPSAIVWWAGVEPLLRSRIRSVIDQIRSGQVRSGQIVSVCRDRVGVLRHLPDLYES